MKRAARKKIDLAVPEFVLGLVVVALIGVIGYYTVHAQHTANDQYAASNTPRITKSTNTNTWTGSANTYKWSDAKNWSLGAPKDGQTLEIDVAMVKEPVDQYGTQTVPFQDDMPDLSIKKLLLDGKTDAISINVKGDSLTITDGIEAIAGLSGNRTHLAGLEVQFDNQIIAGGDVAVKTASKNKLTFYSNTETPTLDLGVHTLSFTSADSDGIEVFGPLSGTGTVTIPDNAHTSLLFEKSSPQFSGKVYIGNGDSATVGNEINGGYGLVDALGTSSIEIAAGGSMSVFAAGTSTFAISNPISLSGVGDTDSDGNTSGAISACVTTAQEGCTNSTVTFTQPITLNSDAQIGTSSPASAGSSNLHVNYIFNAVNKNGHTLTTVTDYHYVPNF